MATAKKAPTPPPAHDPALLRQVAAQAFGATLACELRPSIERNEAYRRAAIAAYEAAIAFLSVECK